MSYWDYEEPIWEPSEADELFDDIKKQLIEAAKSSIKSDMESLKERNEFLEKRNKELENKAREVANKERELQYKAENIEREVKREFYSKSVDNALKEAVADATLYFANNTPHKRPKCELCDENRQRIYVWDDGVKAITRCACADMDYWYEPEVAETIKLKCGIEHGRYNREKHFYAFSERKPVNYDDFDGYDYREFKIIDVVDEFNEDTKELYGKQGWRCNIGFRSEEECQKFCDWLNEEKGLKKNG